MSMTLGVLLGAALLGSAVFLGVQFHRKGRRPRSALLASLAGRWEGRVLEGGVFAGDRLEIRVDGIAGEVTFADQDETFSGWTRLRFDWPSDRRLRVASSDDVLAQVRHLLAATNIEFSEPEFDGLFHVESSHPGWARAVLDPAIRRSLVEFHRSAACYGSGGITLHVGPFGMVLKVMNVLVDNSLALGSFMDLGIALLQNARGRTVTAGVEVEPVRTGPGSVCPVCGNKIEDAVDCPACGMPHHQDCWNYLGGCAIYGCKGQSEARAR